jgi:hypothetical protein
MRIVISGPAAAYDADSEEEITDPALLRRLAGHVVPDAACADFLDAPIFDEIDLTGGRIEAAFHPARGLRVVTEYCSPRALSGEELVALTADTQGQWSDGAGENGIDVTLDGRGIRIDLSPLRGGEEVEVEQISEDAPPRPRFRGLFAAARRGDVPALRAAIAAGENLDCRKGGMSALQWAIAFGHPEAALLLIESGADVAATDVLGDTALECCAASRDLPDESASRVAEQLLQRSSNADASPRHRERALEIATLRGKERLAKLLAGDGPNQVACCQGVFFDDQSGSNGVRCLRTP